MNVEDQKRDQILRFLYERHKTTKAIGKLPIGIRDLQSEMKKRHAMKQHEVASNLDYLIQAGWVRDVVKDRSFETPRGMKVSAEQVKYKVSDVGITHLEAGTVFKRPETASHINITNVQGVTILGDGNIVNAQFTDLARALDDLDRAIATAPALTDEQRLNAAGDLATIRSQIAKKEPLRQVIKSTWGSLESIATLSGVADAAARVAGLLGPFL